MPDEKQSAILAVVTSCAEQVMPGGCPVFVVENQTAIQEMAKILQRIMDAHAHELNEQTVIIVAH